MGRGSSKAGGSSGGGLNAIQQMFDLADNDGNSLGRIFEVQNTVYLQRRDGTINPLPSNTDLNGYLNNVRNAGGTTSLVTKTQLKQEMAQKQAYRAQIDAFLNKAYVSDTHFVSGSRRARIGNRATRRAR